MTNPDPIRVFTDCKATKAFPTLQCRTETHATKVATRHGFKRFVKRWSIDGESWFKTAKEAKKSQGS